MFIFNNLYFAGGRNNIVLLVPADFFGSYLPAGRKRCFYAAVESKVLIVVINLAAAGRNVNY